MWCKNCNIETNEPVCPRCNAETVEDLPVEIYWCHHCKTPVVQNTNQADKGVCPLCGRKTKYLSSDLRPVFPEERLLLELLLGKTPNEYINSSVWAANSRYYIDGKSFALPAKAFATADTDNLIESLKKYKGENSYDSFNEYAVE